MAKPLERIDVDKIQRQIIGEFAEIIAQETELSRMVIKGFLWKALRKWQKIHGMTHSDTEKDEISPAERIQQTKEIFDIFRPTVISSTKVEEKFLASGIKKALQHYEQYFANR